MKTKIPEDFCKTGASRPVAYIREAAVGQARIFDCRLNAVDLERLAEWCLEAAQWCRESEPTVQLKTSEKTSKWNLKKAFNRERS